MDIKNKNSKENIIDPDLMWVVVSVKRAIAEANLLKKCYDNYRNGIYPQPLALNYPYKFEPIDPFNPPALEHYLLSVQEEFKLKVYGHVNESEKK